MSNAKIRHRRRRRRQLRHGRAVEVVRQYMARLCESMFGSNTSAAVSRPRNGIVTARQCAQWYGIPDSIPVKWSDGGTFLEIGPCPAAERITMSVCEVTP